MNKTKIVRKFHDKELRSIIELFCFVVFLQNTLSPHTPLSALSMSSNSPYSTFNANNSHIAGSLHSLNMDELELMNSPHIPTKEAFNMLLRPKTYAEKARMNKG